MARQRVPPPWSAAALRTPHLMWATTGKQLSILLLRVEQQHRVEQQQQQQNQRTQTASADTIQNGNHPLQNLPDKWAGIWAWSIVSATQNEASHKQQNYVLQTLWLYMLLYMCRVMYILCMMMMCVCVCVYIYMNTCWVPHLKMSPKHFTVATTCCMYHRGIEHFRYTCIKCTNIITNLSAKTLKVSQGHQKATRLYIQWWLSSG